jgi:hypothetical protein
VHRSLQQQVNPPPANILYGVSDQKKKSTGILMSIFLNSSFDLLLSSISLTQGLSGSRIRENHDYIHTKIIETTDQFELKNSIGL